jgi:hypothetical protein
MAQVPITQVPVALVGLHAWLQPPQFAIVLSCVSQPFAGLPSQSPNPALQVLRQTPSAQLTWEALVPWQATPQSPQLLTLVFVLTQLPLQLVSPLAQLTTHCPPEQTFSAPQALPQAPQWLTSLLRSAQVPSQLVCPVLHRLHWPPAQV